MSTGQFTVLRSSPQQLVYSLSPSFNSFYQVIVLLHQKVPLISLIAFLIFLTNGIILAKKARQHEVLIATGTNANNPYFKKIRRSAYWTLTITVILVLISIYVISSLFKVPIGQVNTYSGTCQEVWNASLNDFILPPGC